MRGSDRDHVRDEFMTDELRASVSSSDAASCRLFIAHYIANPAELEAEAPHRSRSILKLHDNDRLAQRLVRYRARRSLMAFRRMALFGDPQGAANARILRMAWRRWPSCADPACSKCRNGAAGGGRWQNVRAAKAKSADCSAFRGYESFDPDLILINSYSMILSPDAGDPRDGAINIHARCCLNIVARTSRNRR